MDTCGTDANLNETGFYCDNAATVQPVAPKTPNIWGLYDISGNVYEMCRDWYGPYPSGAATDPTGLPYGASRVRRGGDCIGYPKHLRSAFRGYAYPAGSHLFFYTGFRLMRQF